MTEAKRRLLAARAMNDVASAQSAVVVRLAESLHVFSELRSRGPMTVEEIAEACHVRTALASHILLLLAASGYVERDATRNKYHLSAEQESLFADEDDPLFLGGAFQLAVGLARDDRDEIRQGIARSSRAKFPSLVSRKLASRLVQGASIAELGCGSGATLIEIARRYPAVRAIGIDRDTASVAQARSDAERLGVADRVSFVEGDEHLLVNASCDIVLSVEALHEFAKPVEVARAVFKALSAGGVWLIVEPCADRLGPGNDTRFLASLAALYCLPASDFAPHALGPLTDRITYERVIKQGGFDDVTIEEEGPVHIIVQARR